MRKKTEQVRGHLHYYGNSSSEDPRVKQMSRRQVFNFSLHVVKKWRSLPGVYTRADE